MSMEAPSTAVFVRAGEPASGERSDRLKGLGPGPAPSIAINHLGLHPNAPKRARSNSEESGFMNSLSSAGAVRLLRWIFPVASSAILLYMAMDRTAIAQTTQQFTYGFDLTVDEPDYPGTDPGSGASALEVMSSFPGLMYDISIDGFGVANTEPTSGDYDFGSTSTPQTLAYRINMITNAGGVPVITLIGAPTWMQSGPPFINNGTSGGCANNDGEPYIPPQPGYYTAFANLAVQIADAFPQVKYFVVWNEMKCYWDASTNSADYVDYTDLYNAVYTALKTQTNRTPDNVPLVGGPYSPMAAFPHSDDVQTIPALSGDYGDVRSAYADVITYWLKNKVGADFICNDAETEIAKARDEGEPDPAGLTDPVTASGVYAAVDKWIFSQEESLGLPQLPIWWMESDIQPDTGWTDEQAAAARIATLAIMASSGASVGMQWQPQDQMNVTGFPNFPDEGLWTSTLTPGGGLPTTLAGLLPAALPILEQGPVLTTGEPTGVLVAQDNAGLLAVNTNATSVMAVVGTQSVQLGPAQVLTLPAGIVPAAATPTFSPATGTYTSAQTVAISDSTSSAAIYYTTDGTTPTTNSTVYSGPIIVSSSEMIQAIATASGYATSAVASTTYSINIPTNSVPVIGSISPTFTSADSAAFTLTVTGTGFISGSVVNWGSTVLTTQYVSGTQVTAQVPVSDVGTTGSTSITVQNPSPGGDASNSLFFETDSAGTTPPKFTTVTATVTPGSTATYQVTLPSSATNVSVTCLNMPSGATCSYSSTTGAVAIMTSSSTPAGTYQITVVFTETLPGSTTAIVLLPILLLPLMMARRKLNAERISFAACLGLVLIIAAVGTGCGGAGSSSSSGPQTHQVTSSGAVSLTVQ
jgi:hypothetical protein